MKSLNSSTIGLNSLFLTVSLYRENPIVYNVSMPERSEISKHLPKLIDATRPYFAEHLLSPELPRFSTGMAVSFIDLATTENGKIVPSTLIVTAVRDSEDPTDPNVISLPTKRLQPPFVDSLLRHYEPADVEEIGDEKRGKKVKVKWRQKSVYDQSLLRDDVQEVLIKKLGAKEALSQQQIIVPSIKLENSSLGKVFGTNEDPENGEDMLHMLGIRADIAFPKGVNPFPEKTDHYYGIQFMRVDDFARLVTTKDPYIIARFGDFSKICVKGLCVDTGNKIVNDSIGKNKP